MGNIEVLIVLIQWITFLILTEISNEKYDMINVISKEIKQQDLEKLQNEQNLMEGNLKRNREYLDAMDVLDDSERYDWSDNEVEIIPDCVPNFFMPVSEPCHCMGSGKTIKENEVGSLYCFPQPNKFKTKFKDKYETISTPEQYERNMVPNEELKSCVPNGESSIEEVCFCGSEKDKDHLKKNGSQNFVDLKHICVPLSENEKYHSFSLLSLPHHKLPYCYRKQCHRNAHLISQNAIGNAIHTVGAGGTLVKYLSYIEKILLAGVDRYARFEIQRLISVDGDDIARMLFQKNKSELYSVTKSFEENVKNFGIGRQSFSLQAGNKYPDFEIILQNSEINRFFPIFGTLEFSFKQLNGKFLNVGIKKVDKNTFYTFSNFNNLSKTRCDQATSNIGFQDECDTAEFSIKFYPEKKQIIYFQREEPYDLRSLWFKAQGPTTESTYRFIADLYKFFSVIKEE